MRNNTAGRFLTAIPPKLVQSERRELRANDGACKFSYVPTPYFSFLVGTQRDILRVEARLGCRLSG